MGLADIYSYLIANWLNGGNFIRRSKISSTEIKVDYNLIMTKQSVKKIFRIPGIKPENVDLCFIDYIRDRLFELDPEVRVQFNIAAVPCRIDVNGDRFVRAMTKASTMYGEYKEAFESQSGIARLTGKTYRLPGGGSIRMSKERLDNFKQLHLSYLEVFHHVSEGDSVSQCNIFIELLGQSIKELNRAREDLYGILGQLNIGCEELRSVNKAYLWEQGPATPPPKTLNKKFLPQMLFTDVNSAAFSSYKSRGLVGGSGLLMGMDFRSRLPLSINIFEAPAAQVFMILGKTGSGKTYAAFQMALSAVANGEFVSAIDIKGREWSKLSRYIQSKIITFDDKHPSFVNVLRLDDLDVTDENAGELFTTAVKGAVSLLMLIVNLQPGEGNPNDLELVLREAVLKLYANHSVTPDNIKSFANSKHLQYADILPILESLQTTISYTKEQREMLSKARARCHAYLGEAGIFSEAFRNEVTLSDVLTTPLVIYEFNKNQGVMSDALDVIRIFMVQFLDSKKKAMLKQKNKFLFCFYEELQRCDQFANLIEYICADVTGSRSNNAVVCLLLNSLKILQDKRAQDIRSNITSFIVGNVESTDIDFIESGFSKPWLASQLRLFAGNLKVYRNCFAADLDTGLHQYETIYRVELPKSMSEQFKTRYTKDEVV